MPAGEGGGGMHHSLARRLHEDEKQIRTVLEGALLQYGVLFGLILLVVLMGVGIVYFRTP
jgi:hypothetical protein